MYDKEGNLTEGLVFESGQQIRKLSIEEAKAEAKAEIQNDSLNSQWAIVGKKGREFYKIYLIEKPSETLLDANGDPVMKKSYPKGKNLFRKSDLLIDYYLVLVKDKNADLKNRLTATRDVIKLLVRLIEIGATDTEALNKAIKKAKSNEDILQVLGVK